jgi:DNA-binding response OmpR family regulator
MNGLLLVESDPSERRRLTRGLEANGWNVWAVADASAARRIIDEQSDLIQVALVDLQLPGFEGRRLLDELERLDPPPVCIAISLRPSVAALEAFRRLSRCPLLVKPVEPNQVDAVLWRIRNPWPLPVEVPS